MDTGTSQQLEPSSREVRAELERIGKSKPFKHAGGQLRMLEVLVAKKLAGLPDSAFKETILGQEIFNKDDYDPALHSNVPSTASRLRATLANYFDLEGRDDLVVIEIPTGSYVPVFYFNPVLALGRLSDEAAMEVAMAKAAIDKRGMSGYVAALAHLDAALGFHPKHPRILSLKAIVHAGRALFGGYPKSELQEAERVIDEVKSQKLEVWECHYAEAEIRMDLYWDWAGAEKLFDRAILLSHGEARFRASYTGFLAAILRPEEAVRLMQQAISHSGNSAIINWTDLAMYQFFAGQYEEALRTLRYAMNVFPGGHYLMYLHLAIVHEAMGRPEEARNVIEQAAITREESTMLAGVRYMFAGLAGDRRLAEDGLRELQLLRAERRLFIPASQLATAALGVGDLDAAVSWLTESAVVERDPIMIWVAVFPFHRHLYGHAGFTKLVTETMGLSLSPHFLS